MGDGECQVTRNGADLARNGEKLGGAVEFDWEWCKFDEE